MRVLITGITGQDGAYLAAHLLEQGHEVFGAARRNASRSLWRLDELGITDRVKLVSFELLEFSNMLETIRAVKPAQIYNLAAQSFVGASFQHPIFTADANATAVTRILECIRLIDPEIRFYQASTSEMFGKVQSTPQTEKTPFYPRSPYGVAKLYGHWITVNYREAYNLHASSGILFNHESPLRGLEFVTRKITASLALIKNGKLDKVELGNMDSQRDWGFAGDYTAGMASMLKQKTPGDYILATGRHWTIRQFVEAAATAAGFDLQWDGEGVKTRGIDRKTGKVLVAINPELWRPAEVDVLIGDPTKAATELGWKAQMSVEKLVEAMVKADMDRVARQQPLL
jgi:GDPmannose 4,6-dehydratase